MKNITYKLAALALLASAGNVWASVGPKVTVQAGVITCVHGGGDCNQSQAMTTNAIGEPFKPDPAKKEFKDLGKVTESKVVELAIPQKEGEETLFVFTDKNGKKQYLGFEVKPSPGPGKRFHEATFGDVTFKAGQDIKYLELYTLTEGQKLDDWARMYRYALGVANYPATRKVTLNPDGTVKPVNMGQEAAA